MALVDITIAGVYLDAEGNLLKGKRIKFTPKNIFGANGEIAPTMEVSVVTDAVTGAYSTILLTSDAVGAFVRYTAELHNKKKFDFDLTDDDLTTSLDALYNLGVAAGTSSSAALAILISGKANDSEVVHKTGNETVAGIKTFTSSPIMPTPTADFQAATKKYVDDHAPVLYALEFTPNQPFNLGFADSNVYHGAFYAASATLGKCWWEAWVCPEYGANYFLAMGFGGGHPILVGFDAAASGLLKISGNMKHGVTDNSFGSVDGVAPGTWHHVAVGTDLTNIYVYLDGIATNIVPIVGGRLSGAGSSDLGMWVGASNEHSGFKGKVLRMRGLEDDTPFAGDVFPAAFLVDKSFQSVFGDGAIASFVCDYSKPADILIDYSFAGYGGKRHDGFRTMIGYSFAAEAKLPQWVLADFEKPSFSGAVNSIPSGALLYDDFSRANETTAWQGAETVDYPFVGQARTGQVWQGNSGSVAGQPDVGILEGAAVGVGYTGLGVAYVDVGMPNYIITLTRRGTQSAPSIRFRQTNVGNNFIEASLNSASMVFTRNEGGAVTYVGGGAIANPDWGTAVLTVNGTSISITVGGSTYPMTESTLTTGEEVGFAVGGTSRVETFLVMAGDAADVTAPSVPANFTATTFDDDRIDLAWSASTDAIGVTGYELRRATDSGFTVAVTDIVLGNVLSYQNTGLAAATEYFYKVRARDAVGNWSAYSTADSATTDAPVIQLLLDELAVTATLAVGLRKLRTAYAGACLRVRRVSDNAELDIGFSGEAMDWAAAITFMGASSLVVAKWYDQSGGGGFLDPLATSRQPVLDTALETLDFDGVDDLLRISAVDLSATDKISILTAGIYDVLAPAKMFLKITDLGDANNAEVGLDGTGGFLFARQTVSGNLNTKFGVSDTAEHVLSAVFDRSQAGASDTKFYVDGVEQTSTSSATNVSGVFAAASLISLGENLGGGLADMKAREFIVFASALSDVNRVTGEANIAAFYGI